MAMVYGVRGSGPPQVGEDGGDASGGVGVVVKASNLIVLTFFFQISPSWQQCDLPFSSEVHRPDDV
ncbi:hypothetical protein C1H46_020346 [Malus baccata]|uniref:Uncharacterized protein n=1 Tax=Malus baccata TaxID=106549 RepID=A0A540M5I1_MALBA|nr:hypothetical protein C1H46_020346 [Malus baccata]